MTDTTSPTPPPKGLPPRTILIEALREFKELGPDNPSIPEYVFRDFVKYLYDPATDKFDTELWLRTFGDFKHAINLTDSAGAVVRVCPPLMGMLETKIVDRAESLATLSEMAALNGRRHAALGQRTLQDGLDSYKAGNIQSVRQNWVDILTEYGVLKSAVGEGPAAKLEDTLLTMEGDDL